MNRWSTIVLVGLAVAAVVFLAIYEPLTVSPRERDLIARDRRVLSLNPSEVTRLRIVSGDSEVVLRRRGNGWQLGEKSKDRAATVEVERLLQTAAELQFLDRIDGREIGGEKNLGKYGLRNPKRRIEFDGPRKVVLHLGKEGANEDRLYVRVGDSRDVYLVSDRILRQAFRPAGDFRDRRLTDLRPAQIDRVLIRRPDGEIELVQEARGWKMVRPLHVPADGARVAEFLNFLLGLRVTEYISEDSGDLGTYGIVEGQKEITFYAEGSDRPQTLRLGTGQNGELYGQFTARDSVYRLPAEAAELLDITPATLRDRKLLPVNLDIVDRIRITSPERTLVLNRDGEGWVLVSGGATAPASDAAVQALVSALATAEVSDFTPITGAKLSAAGLVTPQVKVEFLSVLSENTPEATAGEQTVASAAFGTAEAGQVRVRVGDSPEIATVDEGLLAVLPADPQAWRAPVPARKEGDLTPSAP
jgi:hypothetical protein